VLGLLKRLYAPVVVETRVPAERSDVYDVLADPETYPSWLVGNARVAAVDHDFPEPGAEFEHTVTAGLVRIDDHSESLGAEDNRRLAMRVHAGGFHARVQFDLESCDDRATNVRLAEQPIGLLSIVTPLLRPLLYTRNRASLERLREYVGP
jgi:uncharacterized protein YndB with AHSA1/START domain